MLNILTIIRTVHWPGLLTIVLLLGCTGTCTSNKQGKKIGEARVELNISAHLIYEDGTLSSFDVLKDKSLALWNVTAGGGDAIKPSDSTKITFRGNLDSLTIKIKNGSRPAVDTFIVHLNKEIYYTIKETGCSEVYVDVTRKNKLFYRDTIPFHCGE
jgi:hypothetical protein